MKNLFCGVDFHKRTCTIFVCDREGRQLGHTKRFATERLLTEIRNLTNVTVGIECSGGVNFAAQELKDAGIDVRIINANKSRAIGYGGKKTDAKDAETIAHLLRSEFAPEVALRSKAARDMSMLITAREHLVAMRTSLICHIRGLLREYGLVIDAGVDKFMNQAKSQIGFLKIQNPLLADILLASFEQVVDLKNREVEINTKIAGISNSDERISRIRDIPGVGPLGAFLMVAVIDDVTRFKDASSFASYLGLVPREDSSGDRKRLGSITKAGNETLRRYLIHGARAILMSKHHGNDPVYKWAKRLEERRGRNKATVALAHKLSRICFALIRDGGNYSKAKKITKAKTHSLAAA